MDYLDRLAIPIPEHPIDESTLERRAADERYLMVVKRSRDSLPEGSPYRIALEKILADEQNRMTLETNYSRRGRSITSALLAKNIAEDRFVQWWDVMAAKVHALAVDKGWWENDRNDGEIIALLHSELSEALEALRNGNPTSEKIPGFSSLEEELADEVIRIMDYSAARGLRVGEAVVAKHAFNIPRPYKHGKKF